MEAAAQRFESVSFRGLLIISSFIMLSSQRGMMQLTSKEKQVVLHCRCISQTDSNGHSTN